MADDGEGEGPLAGVKVLDLTRFQVRAPASICARPGTVTHFRTPPHPAAVAVQNGPSATRCLADYGCTVVKIEGMRGDEMRGLGKAPDNFNFVQEGFNRSKLSLTLDLCAPHPPPPARPAPTAEP